MSEITINDLGALSDYATSITQFTTEYQDAIETVRRHFTDKVEGAQAEAIEAFFAKLNAIQESVFDTYPQALTDYTAVVTTYESTISGLGFSTKAYSSDTDASTVASLLTGTQLDAVTEITGNLKTAFQTAADAMGTEAESVDSIDSAAESSLSAAGSNRTQTDAQMQEAFETFKSGLSSQTENLTALQSSLKSAANITNIPLTTVFNAISNGTLNANEMYYFDALTNKSDVKIVKTLLSEYKYADKAEFFEKLGKIDATNASVLAVSAVYGRILEEIPSEAEVRASSSGIALTNVEAFLSGIASQDKTAATAYLKKLTQAGTITAALLTSEATSLLPEFPKTGSSQSAYEAYWQTLLANQPIVETINADLKRAGLLSDIFTIAYIENIGTTEHEVSYQTYINWNSAKTLDAAYSYMSQISLDKGSLYLKADENGTVGVSMTITSSGEEFKGNSATWSKSINSINYYNQSELNYAQTADKMKELESAKQEALKSLQVKTLTSSLESVAGVLAPEWSVAIGVLKTLSGDGSTAAKVSDVSNDVISQFVDSKGHEVTVSLANSIRDYYDAVADINKTYNQAIQLAQAEGAETREAILFNYGGTHVTVTGDGETNYSYLTPEYDLEASLQIYDMEANGLRAQVFRDAAGASQTVTPETMEKVDNFDKAIDNTLESNKFGPSVKDFLSGNSNQSISDIGVENISNGLKNIENQSKDIPTCSDVIESRYFENYVRGRH